MSSGEDLEVEARQTQLEKLGTITAHRRAEIIASVELRPGRLLLRLRKL